MISFAVSLKNRARSFLRLQKERSQPPRGPKPRLGATIVWQDVRLTVQAGLSEDLWRWLVAMGWREERYRPDRRSYRDIAPSDVTLIIDASPEDREDVLNTAVVNATWRPSMQNRGGITVRGRR